MIGSTGSGSAMWLVNQLYCCTSYCWLAQALSSIKWHRLLLSFMESELSSALNVHCMLPRRTCALLSINLYDFMFLEVICICILICLNLMYTLHWKTIPTFITLLSVPVNHKCGDCGVFVCVIQSAAEKPDGFKNEITQWGFTLLCKGCYHWKAHYMPF
jgi:hypothetical protein